LLQVPMFLAFFLIVRGMPAMLALRDLDIPGRIALALVSATELPLVVAITEIGLRSGHLQAETAASLVGAGMAWVLVFPLAALTLRRIYAPQTTESSSMAWCDWTSNQVAHEISPLPLALSDQHARLANGTLPRPRPVNDAG